MKPSRMPVTIGLIVACVVAYLLQLSRASPMDPFGLFSLGAIVPGIFDPATSVHGDYWRLLASMFLHVGVFHLLLNMWALYQLGFLFEVMFGSARLLLTYFASGIVASVAATLLPPHALTAGASGAIFGILGALIFAIRRSPVWRHEPWTKGLIRQLVIWAGINIVIGFTFEGIDNSAHIGGFVTGLILGFIPHRVPPPPPKTMVIDAEHGD